MERKGLWILMLLLVVVNVMLLLDRRNAANSLAQVRREAAIARLESRYTAEEETLLIETRAVPSPLLRQADADTEVDLHFLLLASIDDCTNCIEDEIVKLNEISLARPARTTSVRAIYVDADRAPRAEAVIANLSPAPAFPVSVQNVMTYLPTATTPLVLVVRTADGKILDAHKPIPENLSRRDAFYERWHTALDVGDI